MAVFYEEVLRGLQDAGVDYVVVGGTAVVLHGVPRTTADLDIVPDLYHENINRLVAVLASLGYRPRAPVDPNGLVDPSVRRVWHDEKGMQAFSFWNPDRPLDAVDILFASPLDYSTLAARASPIEVAELRLLIASVEDLVTMKQNTGRPQDESDIDALERLRRYEDEDDNS